MLTNDERPGIEEQYSQAASSSNLRCEADRRGASDILIASGMSGSVLGGALMRLHTEYNRGGVPRGNATQTDHILMMGQLKTLRAVLDAVTSQAVRWDIERPEKAALAVVAHWLDSTCHHCEGRGKERIKDTPALSGKNCKHCHGTGHTMLPYGSAGRQLEGYMQDCLNRWRQLTSKRLHGLKNSA